MNVIGCLFSQCSGSTQYWSTFVAPRWPLPLALDRQERSSFPTSFQGEIFVHASDSFTRVLHITARAHAHLFERGGGMLSSGKRRCFPCWINRDPEPQQGSVGIEDDDSHNGREMPARISSSTLTGRPPSVDKTNSPILAVHLHLASSPCNAHFSIWFTA